MVEVVSPPTQLTCKCHGCGAGLSYTQPEVKSKTVGDYGGGRDTYYYIKCPICAVDVHVPGYLPRR